MDLKRVDGEHLLPLVDTGVLLLVEPSLLLLFSLGENRDLDLLILRQGRRGIYRLRGRLPLRQLASCNLLGQSLARLDNLPGVRRITTAMAQDIDVPLFGNVLLG